MGDSVGNSEDQNGNRTSESKKCAHETSEENEDLGINLEAICVTTWQKEMKQNRKQQQQKFSMYFPCSEIFIESDFKSDRVINLTGNIKAAAFRQ